MVHSTASRADFLRHMEEPLAQGSSLLSSYRRKVEPVSISQLVSFLQYNRKHQGSPAAVCRTADASQPHDGYTWLGDSVATHLSHQCMVVAQATAPMTPPDSTARGAGQLQKSTSAKPIMPAVRHRAPSGSTGLADKSEGCSPSSEHRSNSQQCH